MLAWVPRRRRGTAERTSSPTAAAPPIEGVDADESPLHLELRCGGLELDLFLSRGRDRSGLPIGPPDVEALGYEPAALGSGIGTERVE